MTVRTRLRALEQQRRRRGISTTGPVPTHRFDYAAFERCFGEMANSEPDFVALWLREHDRHDPA